MELPNHIGRIKRIENGVAKYKLYRIDGNLRPIKGFSKGLVHEYEEKNKEERGDFLPKLKIERNLFQTTKDSKNLPTYIKIKQEFNRDFHEGFHYYMYDDTDIEKIYINDNTELSNRALQCSKVLNTGAFKADIFRYYILYTRGGVWMDDKSILRISLNDKYFSLDKYDGFIVYGSFANGIEISFIASRSGSPFFKALLEECLKNIENREYFDDPLHITGPRMAYGVFKNIIKQNVLELNEFKIDDYVYKIFHVYRPQIYLNSNLIWSQFDANLNLLSKIFDPNYYSVMWNRGNIYVDDNNKHKLTSKCIYLNGYYLFCFVSLAIIMAFAFIYFTFH